MYETGKERKARIEPGYYRRGDALARRRRGLVALVLLLTLAGLALAPTWGRDRAGPSLFRWTHLASHGELARPHAMWESRCEACHVPLTPVNGSRWAPLNAGSRASDGRCLGCHAAADHPGAGHAVSRPADAVACAECHRDHRGRDASLVRLADATCTRCHADLDGHREGQAGIAPHVAGFPAGHPPFTQRDDPAPIAFNHARHLAPGMPAPKGGPVLTYAQLDPEARARYAGKPALTDAELEAPVALDCASCHRLDAAGALMLPVSYEASCRACHPLNYDPVAPERTVPHGQQPGAIVAALRDAYRAEAALADPALVQRPLPPRPLPNRRTDAAPGSANAAADERLTAALRTLFVAGSDDSPADRRGCRLCHRLDPARDPGTIARLTIERPGAWFATPGTSKEATPWYVRAAFHHNPHRSVTCVACHEGVNTSEVSGALHMPDRDQCARCHHDGTTSLSLRLDDGASARCTECHRYHPRGAGGR